MTLVFRVEQVYKGDINNRVEVVTAQRRRLVRARGRGSASASASCSSGKAGPGARASARRSSRPAFLELTDVEDNAFPAVNWGGIVAGILILLAAGWLLLRRPRRYRASR